MMMKNIQMIIFIAALLLMSSCGENKEVSRRDRALPVVTGQVTQKDVPLYIEAIGNVYPMMIVQVRPQITGKLIKVHVNQGQDVHKGDLLYTIDPAPFKAQLDQAIGTLKKDEASLEFAKIRVERNKELVKKDYIAKLTFDQYVSEEKSYEGQIDIDKAYIDTAKINLDYCYIHSPIDGRISQYYVDIGNIVSPTDATALTDIRQITPADIRFSLPQSDFEKIMKYYTQKNIQIEVLLPDSKVPEHIGEVYFIDNRLDLSTGTILLKGKVKNEKKTLWPGEFVRVRVLLKTIKNALLVPQSAVQVGQQGNYIYVLKPDNTVELRLVTIGQRDDTHLVIKKGITLEDVIIVDGQVNLRPGSKVYISNPTSTETPETQAKKKT